MEGGRLGRRNARHLLQADTPRLAGTLALQEKTFPLRVLCGFPIPRYNNRSPPALAGTNPSNLPANSSSLAK